MSNTLQRYRELANRSTDAYELAVALLDVLDRLEKARAFCRLLEWDQNEYSFIAKEVLEEIEK